jgi:ubiquinone/menaquinone biosynthesis C-methylase UbiE
MQNLNVGVGTIVNIATPLICDCLNVDVFRLVSVSVVCDVQYLPFRNRVFRNVFCFHVLEHISNPAKGLAELVRVSCRLVEVEVPHRFGSMAKSHRRDKGNVALSHACSFRPMWFHQCLKNYRRCVKVFYEFPRNLLIHVWVYVEKQQ